MVPASSVVIPTFPMTSPVWRISIPCGLISPLDGFILPPHYANFLTFGIKYGSGVLNMHGATGDLIFLGTNTDSLEPCFQAVAQKGWDIGGSGSAMRSPSCCCGQARCEWSCYDTMEACYQLTQEFQFDLHRPSFPYKYKLKFSGCPNDCVASVARSDMSMIGVWKDDIRIDQAAVAAYIGGELKAEGGGAND